MARFSGFLLFFSILLTLSTTSVSQTVVESSPPLSQTVAESNITIGSSISAAGASFWLSPSGIFSFGFYPINTYYQEYIIGIWINNNPIQKTLVWSINRDDSPFSIATSLLLNNYGKFVIQFSNGAEEKPLFHQADSLLLSSPISYASILDNGNLVFYNSNSTIIWNSFSYPTDTILPGQTLHPKQSLTSVDYESDASRSSDMYRLIMKSNGNLLMYTMKQFYRCPCREWDDNSDHTYIYWETNTEKKNGSPVELKLDSTGHLYLGDWNGVIKKSLNNGSIYKGGEGEEQQQDKVIYRATLERDGVFRLYKETIDHGNASAKEEEIHTVVWDTRMKIDDDSKLSSGSYILLSVYLAVVVIAAFFVMGLCLLELFSTNVRDRVAIGTVASRK